MYATLLLDAIAAVADDDKDDYKKAILFSAIAVEAMAGASRRNATDALLHADSGTEHLIIEHTVHTD